MEKFKARTRVRGEVGYYLAAWTRGNVTKTYIVRFLEGPHKWKAYTEPNVAIASDEQWKLKGENNAIQA